MKKKTMWIITMLGLCLVLYTIVVSRMESSTNVIFGGAEDAFVRTDSMNFTDLSATETPEPTVDIWPKLTTDDFEKNHCLWMVRENSLLSSAYKPDIAKISRTRYMMYSTEYMDELDAFLDAIEDAGFEYFIGAAFREYSFQTHLFNSKASQIAYEMGLSADYLDPKYQEAVEKAKTIVMYPGSSEHQLGVAIDIFDQNRSRLVYSEMNQELFAWLDEHCAEYGFIKRYPTRKLLLTGWDEPWHYRYVGKEVATFIMENGLCYEEFYGHYFPDFEY
ncbi:MAG: M15 family metallopeptidase [Candidatus Limivicinus sp.]|nr:M15 family metallopeptidase [Candidatus Limivicinus sp.]MDY5082951.1 M15 family metallopeptidase [Candidatus Limivicinus sp.]